MNILTSISLTQTQPCLAEPGKIIVTGKPTQPLNDVLPFLATLPNIIAYNPEMCTLTFRRQAGFLTLYADKVVITQVKDVDEGMELFSALVEAINTTWERRLELVAVTARRNAPRPLDIWRLLPQTNCKQCGEATCMAFAAGLLLGNKDLEECQPLHNNPAFSTHRTTLEALL